MDRLVALCKRRGIIFPSSEIYGGIGSAYDYGPIGSVIKRNISNHWLHTMTQMHDDIVELDSAIIYNPRVWEASGHVGGFNDPLIECRECQSRFREDIFLGDSPSEFIRRLKSGRFGVLQKHAIDMTLLSVAIQQFGTLERIMATPDDDPEGEVLMVNLTPLIIHLIQCPVCGKTGGLTVPRKFNLMMKTFIGPVESESNAAYLRPETAQGIYIDYKIVMETSRLRPPFGIAQIGKAFRNEITTKNFIARTREFEQMEMQFFIKPGENEKWCDYWREQRWNYLMDLGVRPEKLRWHAHEKLAHYARAAWDIEYEFPYGWGELEGLHDRGDFDLSRHSEFSGKDLSYFDDSIKERYIPHIIESSSGLNRAMLMLLCEAYHEDVQAGEERVYLSLDPRLAPIKAAFLPLVKKDGLFEIAESLYLAARKQRPVFFDEAGSIGKRYRRQDEIGTPFCFTIDYQTKEDWTVTVRWRDTLQQERIGKDRIEDFLAENLSNQG